MREKGGLRLGLLVAVWTLPLVYWSVQAYVLGRRFGKPIPLADAFTGEILYCALWIALTPLVLWLSRRFPMERGHWVTPALVHLGFAIALSVTHRVVLIFMARPVIPKLRETSVSEQLQMLMFYDYGIGIYWLTLLIDRALVYYQRYRQEEVRVARLEAQLSQAQLAALKMQLHPHFLFNTLHAISALVQEDPEAAERMIARLSELLRLSLDSVGTQVAPLRKELEFLERYLEIERIRFEDRLDVQFDIDPETLDAAVPSLILQPLVENAIRHGLANLVGTGRIAIRARQSKGRLTLQVADNGAGLGSGVKQGMGLGITRARLEGLYGSDQRLDLRPADGGGVEVTLDLPLRKEALPAGDAELYAVIR